jgi:hypothetical protein
VWAGPWAVLVPGSCCTQTTAAGFVEYWINDGSWDQGYTPAMPDYRGGANYQVGENVGMSHVRDEGMARYESCET